MRRWLIAASTFVLVALVALAARTLAWDDSEAERPPSSDPPVPITSAGDPSAPVPFHWEFSSGSAPSRTLSLQGGTLHAIPSEVRVLDTAGQIVASAPVDFSARPSRGLCGQAQPIGMVQVDIALPMTGEWPPTITVEAKVGDRWRPVERVVSCVVP